MIMQILTDDQCETLSGGALVNIGDISPKINVVLANQLSNQFGLGFFGSRVFNGSGQLVGIDQYM